jgi:hypothetical protein
MTKSQFLSIFGDALGNLDANQKAEILSEFEEHYAMAARDGKREEDVSRALGDPLKIASQYFLYEDAGAIQTDSSEPGAEEINLFLPLPLMFKDIRHVTVDVKRAQVFVTGDGNSEPAVRVTGRAVDSKYSVTCEKGFLTVIEEQLRNGFINFVTKQDHALTVEIMLPKKSEPDISIINNGGDTEVNHTSGKHLEVMNAAGQVNISYSTWKKITVRSAAGGVHVLGCTSGKFDIHSATSAVTVEHATGDLSIHAPAGMMHILNYSGRVEMVENQGDNDNG